MVQTCFLNSAEKILTVTVVSSNDSPSQKNLTQVMSRSQNHYKSNFSSNNLFMENFEFNKSIKIGIRDSMKAT
jgi:hemerythrin